MSQTEIQYRQSELDCFLDSFDSTPTEVETSDYDWFPLALLEDEPEDGGNCPSESDCGCRESKAA